MAVFEPTTQQFIVFCPYNELRVFRDLETQTLFRVVIDGKPLVFASPFRGPLLTALQTYTSVLFAHPEYLGRLRPDCTISVPTLLNCTQTILHLEAGVVRVVSDRGGLVYRFMYAQMTSVVQTPSGCRIELENGETLRLDVAEGSLRPLVHCAL